MTMEAYLLGFGPFSKEVCPYLMYPEEDYSKTKDGAIVAISVGAGKTEEDSLQLAEIVGITDPYDFNQHFPIIMEKINWDLLKKVAGDKNVEIFKLLFSKGFKFIFMPNY